MQQLQRRRLYSLLGILVTMAALLAPPSVFAETAPVTPAVPAAPEGAVKIGLGRSLTAADVAAPGGLYVVGDGAVQLQTEPGKPVHVALDGTQIAVTGAPKKFTAVRLVPIPPPATTPPTPPATPPAPPTVPPVPANPVTYNKKTYRGEMAVVVTKSQKLSLINVVNLDEYLLGVVPEEMPSGWPQEALKAQAVAARTYSLTHLGRWSDEGFDMVDTTSDQAYGGISEERPQTGLAVVATRGQVLTYGTPGKPISAMYFSSSGGYTENNDIIMANAPASPYLRGVPDYDNVQGNSNFAWSRSFTVEDFVRALKTGGYDVGTVTGVAPSGPTGVSGRASYWTITGTGGTKTITGTQMRNTLPGVSSNPKTITLQAGGLTPASKAFAETGSFFVMGAGGIMNRPVKGTSVLSAPKAFTVVAGAVTAIGAKVSQPSGVTVTGGGSGHAVGMSQWGAYGMALQGKTYAEILTHYYTGTQLETRPTP